MRAFTSLAKGVVSVRRYSFKLGYYVLLLYRNVRVRDWRAYLAMGMFGFMHNAGFSSPLHFALSSAEIILTLIFYLAFSFSINNCFDVYSDKSKPDKLVKNPIAAGLITFRVGLLFSVSLALTGAFLAYLYFHTLATTLVIYISMILLAGFYSAPPLRFKSRPPLDLVSHGLFFGSLLYLYGASISGEINTYSISTALSILIYSIILELRNHLEDYQADYISGVKTSVYVLGKVKAEKILYALFILYWLYLVMIFQNLYVTSISMLALMLLPLYWKNSALYFRIADASTVLSYVLILLPKILLLFSGFTEEFR